MFVTALLAASLSAPVPKANPAPLYFPTAVGAKRVTADDSGGGEMTEEVTKAEEKDGVYTVTVTATATVNGATAYTMTRVYEVSAGKVVRGTGDERRTVLDLGAKAGTWTVETKGNGQAAVTATFTVGKEEEVEVPAGKFKALPVTERWPHPEGEIVNTHWYAPGVGAVKRVSDTPTSTAALKEFSPGNGAKK